MLKNFNSAMSELIDQEMLEKEMRHKFMFVLKSLYWQEFQKSNCYGRSTIILLESADMCIDTPEKPMDDWKYLQSYAIRSNIGFEALFKCLPCY